MSDVAGICEYCNGDDEIRRLNAEIKQLIEEKRAMARMIAAECADPNGTIWDRAKELQAEVERLNKMRVHCQRCGADYLATGVEAGCPCELRADVARLRSRLQIDPGGSDRIDELEQGAQFLKQEVERLYRLCAGALVDMSTAEFIRWIGCLRIEGAKAKRVPESASTEASHKPRRMEGNIKTRADGSHYGEHDEHAGCVSFACRPVEDKPAAKRGEGEV